MTGKQPKVGTGICHPWIRKSLSFARINLTNYTWWTALKSRFLNIVKLYDTIQNVRGIVVESSTQDWLYTDLTTLFAGFKYCEAICGLSYSIFWQQVYYMHPICSIIPQHGWLTIHWMERSSDNCLFCSFHLLLSRLPCGKHLVIVCMTSVWFELFSDLNDYCQSVNMLLDPVFEELT